MSRIVIWIVGLALLSIVYIATIHFQASNIEKDLGNRAELALIKSNISWPKVQISGRDVILSGTAADVQSINLAEEAVHSVWGVRMVFCQCQVSETKTDITPARKIEPANPTIIIAEQHNNSVVQCQSNIDQLLKEQTIQFPSGSSTISEGSLNLMDQLVSFIKSCPNNQVEIGGHTDSYGDEQKNSDLSLQRALAVLQFLQNAGISKDRLKAIGYGASSPVDTNTTAEGRQRNRRIELHIIP